MILVVHLYPVQLVVLWVTGSIAYDMTHSARIHARSSVIHPTAKLIRVIRRHGLLLYQYADDSQIYTSVTVNDIALAVQWFSLCVAAIND